MASFALSRVGGILAAALTFACLFGAPPTFAETVLRIANLGEPDSLDPHKNDMLIASRIQRNLFEGLVVLDPKGNVVPGAAESWTASEDGLTYRFKLRANAKWSNGDPVTAGDFVFSFRRALDPKTHSMEAELLYPIKNAEEAYAGKLDVTALEVTAPDERTVQITLKAPTPYFLQVLALEQAMPVHEKTVRLGEDWVKPGKMVSNGAYMLDEVKLHSHIRIVKNPHYWDAGKVAIDAIMFDPTENLAVLLKRYRAGEFDITFSVPFDQLGWLMQNMPKELHVAPYAAVYRLAFNTTKPPFNDQRVRQALAMAIDREVLVERVTAAGDLPAYGFVPDGMANYVSQKASWAKMSQADREATAIKLMSEAGFGPKKPLSVKLEYGISENRKRVVVAIAAMWKKLGVNVELTNVEQQVHWANLRRGDFEIGWTGWSADYNDAQDFLFQWQTASKQENYARFSNPDYDRLLDEASVASDVAKRAQLLAQAEQVLLKEMPVLPLYFGVSKDLVSTRVKGWESNLLDVVYVKNLSLEK